MPRASSLRGAVKAAAPHRRMGVITIDQILSGASNLLVILFVAHLLSPGDFGRFAIFFLIYGLMTTAQRALISGPVLVHPEDADERPGEVLGAGVVVGLLGSLLCAAVGLLLAAMASEYAPSLLILAALLPLLLVQDLGRYLSWAVRRPARSVWLDLIWLGLLSAAFAGIALSDTNATLELCIVAWGGSGAAAGCAVIFSHYRLKVTDLSLRWLRERWSFSWRSLLGAVSAQASVLGAATLIATVSTAASVAAVRAVTLLTRPGYAMQVAVGQSMSTDIAREQPSPKEAWAHVRRAVMITFVVSVVNVGILLMLPDVVGESILGNTWPLAAPLLLPAGLQLLLAGLGTGTRDALLGRREISLVTKLDIAGALLLLVASGVGAVIADAPGVLWAMVAAQGLFTSVWWVIFLRRLRAGWPPLRETAVVVSTDSASQLGGE